MQVKKFEARSMKEALEMVKSQLGPEAIILSAKDNAKSFGLVGQGSVEITAAVSNEVLQKRQFVESRMREQDRSKLRAAPAHIQKEVHNKAVSKYVAQNEPKPAITTTKYADIDDDRGLRELISQNEARQVHVNADKNEEIQALREELVGLKKTLQQFQKVPQNMNQGQHPGAAFGLGYEFSAMFEKLTQSGVAAEIAAEILTIAQRTMPPVKFKNKSLIDAWVARYILENTKVLEGQSAPRIQLFVGPAGAGKTSALIKLASHYVVNENKKVALVTTDANKVGAVDQMRIYAQILNVPFAIIRQSSDWDYVSKQLAEFDYILCDAPGLSLKTIDEISWLKSVLPKSQHKFGVHLVLSALTKDDDMTEVGRRYKSIGVSDVIFTSLDASLNFGALYNFMSRFEVPIHSFGIGSRVPEDFEMATRERLLDLIFKLSKIRSKESEL
jgi:flagellar biosynthesis protein FlhF